MKIVFKGDARSKKNSKQAILIRGKPRLIPSKQYQKWYRENVRELKGKLEKWEGDYPVEMRFYFYRSTRRKFDFGNMMEGIQDLLQDLGVIEDDSMNHVYPIPLGWAVDKENPRTEVEIVPIQKL